MALLDFQEKGYCIKRKLIPVHHVQQIKQEALGVFRKVLTAKKMISGADTSEKALFQGMKKLFAHDLITFQNVGKQIQHLIALHQLSLSPEILQNVKALGVNHPVISTRPVLYFNHSEIAKQKVYHTVDAHQDWRSMQGSLNSLVAWIPLMDLPQNTGPLKVLPGSHTQGLFPGEMHSGFGMVNLSDDQREQMETVEMEAGDVLFFSAFLVHASGENTSELPRWSCHFRYNDLDEQTFIERGYPHPYVYKPMPELITKNFPK